MKKYLLLGIIFVMFSCSEHSDFSENSTNLRNVLETQEFKDYNKSHRELLKEIYAIQKEQSPQLKEELLSLLKLCQNNPAEYEMLVKQKIVSLIGENKFAELEEKANTLQNEANILSMTTEYSELTEKEKEEIAIQLMYNFPSMACLTSNDFILSKSGSEEQCIAECAKKRDKAIEQAAITALCGMGWSLVKCLASGGWGTLDALVSAFLFAYAGDVAISNAQDEYTRCVRNC